MSAPADGNSAGMDARFWSLADELVRTHPHVIDRPRGSHHPRFHDAIFPLDYGYLDGTTSADGGGIDVWRGQVPTLRVTGVIATIDVVKGDAELKLLVGCTDEEARLALAQHDSPGQAAVLVLRP